MVSELRSPVLDAKPAALYLYVLGAVFLDVSALFGGGSLITDPTVQAVKVLHFVYGGLGVLLAVLSLTPSFREELE